jgi:hypothetical protein
MSFAAAQNVAQIQKQLERAQQQLDLARKQEEKVDVKKYISSLNYAPRVASGEIFLTGPFSSPPPCPSNSIDLGASTVPMNVFRMARTCDLSLVFNDLWNAEFNEADLFTRVKNFITKKGIWQEILSYDLYILPIHLGKKAAGKKVCDLPNISFIITYIMLKADAQFIVVDPIHNPTDSHVRVTNFTRALCSLQDDFKCRVHTPLQHGRVCADDAFKYVFYQRAQGNLDRDHNGETIQQRITEETGIPPANMLRIKLSPGKYDDGRSCYNEFTKSCAYVLHELSCVDTFAKCVNKRRCNRIHFVLDEFSAYAAFTAVAIIAYGIESVSSLLCYHNGHYCETPIPFL